MKICLKTQKPLSVLMQLCWEYIICLSNSFPYIINVNSIVSLLISRKSDITNMFNHILLIASLNLHHFENKTSELFYFLIYAMYMFL